MLWSSGAVGSSRRGRNYRPITSARKAARDQTIVKLVHSRSARSGRAKSSKFFVVVPSGMQPVQRPCSRMLATGQCSSKARSLAAFATPGLIYSQCETTPMLRNEISKNKRETCKQLRQQHRNALKHERVQTRRRYLRRTRGGGAPTTSKLTQPVWWLPPLTPAAASSNGTGTRLLWSLNA